MGHLSQAMWSGSRDFADKNVVRIESDKTRHNNTMFAIKASKLYRSFVGEILWATLFED